MKHSDRSYGELLAALRRDLQLDASTDILDGTVIPDKLTEVPHASLSFGPNLSVPNNTATQIVWDATPNWQRGGMVVSTAGITVPRDGLYLIVAAARWAANVTGTRQLFVSAAPDNSQMAVDTANLGPTQLLTQLSRLTAATLVTASVVQNSGGALNLLGATASWPNQLAVTFLSN